MAPFFGTIDMLKPGKSTFGLEVRLIRCYENSTSGGIECIFHDRQGERIHVTIPGSNTDKYRNRLIEGSVYALIEFVVGLNIMKYRTTSCVHKIIVFKHTRLFEVFHDEFPNNLFQFKSFPEIAQMENIGESALFDVIGTIVSHYKPEEKVINGKNTRLMELALEDVEGNTINCTVWEKYVDFLDSKPDAPVGMIMQLCRPTLFRGEIKVSTLFNVSKIVTNQKQQDITEFNSSYLMTGKIKSATISTLTASSSRSLDDEIKDADFELKTISEVFKEEKTGNFWVYASVLCVETVGNWSYLACKRRQKKLRPTGNQFFCEKCQTLEIAGRLRYKLTIRVVDQTGTTTFLLWDKECKALLGRTALELMEAGSIEGVPTGFDVLANKRVLFNISVQHGQTRNYTGAFSVARICTDKEVIEKVCGKRVLDEKEDSVSKIGGHYMEEMVESTEDAISCIRTVEGNKHEVAMQKTIQQIIDEKQTGEFWIHAKINSIEEINRFSFLACKKCLKELQPQEELKFFCEECQTFDICGKSRHKVHVKVGDGTGSAILNMWESDGLELIGKRSTTDQLLNTLPTEIEDIVGVKGFFKIIVLAERMKEPFTVVKVTTDEQMNALIKESVARSKGKKKMHGDADEAVYICEALETPPTSISNDARNSADLNKDDETNRKLIDEFSSNVLKKGQKRSVKKE